MPEDVYLLDAYYLLDTLHLLFHFNKNVNPLR